MTDADQAVVLRLLEEHWGGPLVVSRRRLHNAMDYLKLVAVRGSAVIGLITLRSDTPASIEVLTLDAIEPGRGIGQALLRAAVDEARRQDAKRLWLVTTNDNTPALRFYQRFGFRLVALYSGEITHARRLKPSISEIGVDGIPIRDEIELEYKLS